MGIACAPNIFQSIMTELLGILEHVLACIDDILIVQKVGKSEVEHIMMKIQEVLQQLDAKVFCANLRKPFLMQKKVEYLGYLLKPGGLKPQPKNIEMMNHIMRPKNTKQ